MDQLNLRIGTRLQHTQYGPGVIAGIRYATYLISFIHHGIKEIDKKMIQSWKRSFPKMLRKKLKHTPRSKNHY